MSKQIPIRRRSPFMVVGVILLLIAGLLVGTMELSRIKSEKNRDELKEQVKAATIKDETNLDTKSDVTNLDLSIEPIPDYSDIQAKYEDFKGWIELPGWDISYPLFVNDDNPYKYERMTRDGQRSNLGEAGYLGDPLISQNLIVYAHSLTDMSGFAPIDNYPELEPSDEERDVILDLTLKGTRQRWKIVSSAYYEGSDNSYCIPTFGSDEEFAEYKLEHARLKDYDGPLLTLYTCKDHRSTWHTVMYCVPLAQEDAVSVLDNPNTPYHMVY